MSIAAHFFNSWLATVGAIWVFAEISYEVFAGLALIIHTASP
jgi:hypothetical protein